MIFNDAQHQAVLPYRDSGRSSNNPKPSVPSNGEWY